MAYELLEKTYYSNPDYHKELLSQRLHSEYTTHIPFTALGESCFYLLTPELSDLIVSVYKGNHKVDKLKASLPPVAIKQFTRRCLIDEIVLTNSIEGVNSTRRDISDILSELGSNDKKKRFQGLVQKYSMLQKRSDLQLATCNDIRAIYDELVLAEVVDEDPEDTPDGKLFRQGSVSVYSPSQKVIHHGIYPEEAIFAAVEEALQLLRNEQIDLLIRTAIFHYFIGYIHPFYNGNGRLSRFISSHLFAQEFDPLLSYRLSYTIKEDINDYYSAFKICNNPHNCGDLTPFVLYFLTMVNKSVTQLHGALQKRIEQLNYYYKVLERVYSEGSVEHSLAYVLIQAQLFSENGIATKDLLSVFEITRATLTKRLGLLSTAGLLTVNKISTENHHGINLPLLEQLAQQLGTSPSLQ